MELTFLISAFVVVMAGVVLARAGEVIGERTGLGGMWVGTMLLAAATSMPELVTDVSAIRQGHPDIAVGDLFGSTMANMAILALAALMTPGAALLRGAAVNQALVGGVAVLVTVLALIGVLVDRTTSSPLGWSSVAVFLSYLGGMWLVHGNSVGGVPERPAVRDSGGSGARGAVAGFVLAAVVILIVAPVLAASAARLADRLGETDGFVGMVFVGITTSLPEVAVTVAGVRARAYSLVVGNLLGSSCFNMAVLAPLDLVHGAGSLLSGVGADLVVVGMVGVVMLLLAMIQIMDRPDRRGPSMPRLGPVAMLGTYLAGVYFARAAAQ